MLELVLMNLILFMGVVILMHIMMLISNDFTIILVIRMTSMMPMALQIKKHHDHVDDHADVPDQVAQ